METTQLEQELGRSVSGEVRFDPYSRAMYSTDASIYQIEPLGVVLPRSKEDVIATVELARRYGVPILPRGGGTSPGRPDGWPGHNNRHVQVHEQYT